MDRANVNIQVISHAPGCASCSLELCKAANDELAAAVAANSKRFKGFACLPMADPEAAAEELERCVTELGFVGAMVDNHLETGEYYDGEQFWPIFSKAQDLDVCIYFHPTFATDAVSATLFEGNYSHKTSRVLGASAWGWHADTGLHMLRLFAAGLFDKFPNVKIVVGHMGEMLPFMLERCESWVQHFESKHMAAKPKTWRQVYDENLWITTAGFFSVNPLGTILRNNKIDHIMYSIDFPFESNADGLAFLDSLKESCMAMRSSWR